MEVFGLEPIHATTVISVIGVLQQMGLGYGISLILLNIGMYVGIPGIVIVGIRRI
ncbi:MAG: hypothetical protein OER82_10945 [Nitrosopumilus sp.]|nr:hypothetical protein [Nitrosopumilus sp.]